ncbi:MurR/RpiR family transcriptional regulator [Thalassobius vesicularis]|uniref:MurR/RpiR family transcriptional regulator n=1 Tax=Thalassobius vesicularis TaxID=1294297 RepID=A0A4S3M600_9RHOB|nr:MurR/RpiR family transcriptional regulator [Thalassobius vesicularis]THD71756.1 MurR/RpiR family transcriptional regulator [Thalassobius vesicularis]
MKREEKIRANLRGLTQSAPPKLAQFAQWIQDNLHQVAFNSIRGLAQLADVDSNLVTRLVRELGYGGFDAFRAEVQQIVQRTGASYGSRARALRDRSEADIYAEVISASRENMNMVTAPESIAGLDACIEPLLTARRIYVVGVRSCYSIAHYLSYVGGMAFENFQEVPSVPGAILDQMCATGPEDIVIAITYEHYSAEVVRACQVAQDCGARVLAVTDSYNSPIARNAWKVIQLPMAGPQLLPSLNSAFLAVELILAAMTARSAGAADKVSSYEDRITRFGGYTEDGGVTSR